jgi:hypothetical protein
VVVWGVHVCVAVGGVVVWGCGGCGGCVGCGGCGGCGGVGGVGGVGGGGVGWFPLAFEHSKVCSLCDFGHLQFLLMIFIF